MTSHRELVSIICLEQTGRFLQYIICLGHLFVVIQGHQPTHTSVYYECSAPWYIQSKVPTLKHQRIHDEKKKVFAKLDKWQKKGVKDGPVATKYRKGACENCGAMTHKKKDCLEVCLILFHSVITFCPD